MSPRRRGRYAITLTATGPCNGATIPANPRYQCVRSRHARTSGDRTTRLPARRYMWLTDGGYGNVRLITCGRRPDLTLIPRPKPITPVWTLGRLIQSQRRDLADALTET
jgi:hypothetical protein